MAGRRRLSAPPAWLGLLAVAALHTRLCFSFERPGAIFGDYPLTTIDYDTHYEQTLRALEAFERSGRTWSWDPHLLAGSLAGAIFDADNKLHELWVIALHRFGVAPHRAYNLFVVLAHVLVPWIVAGAARILGLRGWTTVAAAALASALWYFDAFSHWSFWVGMISWSLGALLALLPLATFIRWSTTRSPAWLAATLPALALALQCHPYTFFVLAPPMVAAWLSVARRVPLRTNLAVVGVAVAAAAINAWWMIPALRFAHHLLSSDFFLAATIDRFATDWLELTNQPSMHGLMSARTTFRFLALGAAALGLGVLRARRDARFLPLAVAVATLFGATYLGGHLPALRQVQPYRFVLPGALVACFPAALALEELVARWRAAPPPRWTLALLGLLSVAAVPAFARDVLYFLPAHVPGAKSQSVFIPPFVPDAYAFGDLGWPELPTYDHRAIPKDQRVFEDWVRDHDDGSRWLVDNPLIGERLAWATNAQVLGGFRELNLEHSDANFFRRFPFADAPPGELEAYLERYDVGWLILSQYFPDLEARADLLDLQINAFGTRFYRVRRRPGYVVGGPGDVRAESDRIVVRGSAGGRVVLRYHWIETFECRPGCRAVRVPDEHDRVGFVAAEGAPADFEIVNAGFGRK